MADENTPQTPNDPQQLPVQPTGAETTEGPPPEIPPGPDEAPQ